MMSFLKRNGGARVALGALAVLAASAQAVRAETTKLLCNMDAQRGDVNVDDGPTTIELNETQSSVVVHFSGQHVSPGAYAAGIRGGDAPPATIGPMSAKFGTDAITFPSGDHAAYDLNRLTGAFVGRFAGGTLDGKAFRTWTCHAAKKQF